jgi:DNA invertase Pin-like site-specific DNA recombinase
MAIIGYARVSTVDQSLTIQVEKLEAYQCHKIYRDKASGTTSERPQLKACLDYVREGDVLVITKLDRLARSTFNLSHIMDGLKTKGVELVVLDQAIDTSTPTGRLLFNMLGVIAEFENELRRERQMEGIAKAKAVGTKFGAKKLLDEEDIDQLRSDRASGKPVPYLCKKYRVSRTTIYRVLGAGSG